MENNMITAGKCIKRIGTLLVQLLICGVVGFVIIAYMLQSNLDYIATHMETFYGVSIGLGIIHLIIIIKIINNLSTAGDCLMGKSVNTSVGGSSNELNYEKYSVPFIIGVVVIMLLYFMLFA